MIRLGVNVDHVATVRNARGEKYPDPVQAAMQAELGGAQNITCHLREDRRYIRERDVRILKDTITIPLNLEIAATDEMIRFAKEIKPHAVTLVPERREELTTEGGLALDKYKDKLKPMVSELNEHGILVSLFVEPEEKAFDLTKELNAQAVEIHTGNYCHQLEKARTSKEQFELTLALNNQSNYAHNLGLQVHFGHGLNYNNAFWLQEITQAQEANIGHAIVARALFVGFKDAVREMYQLLNDPQFAPHLK